MVLNNSTNIYSNSRYVVDNATPGFFYNTIQSAIDAALANGGNAEIWIRQGDYVEDLTLYDTINLVGSEKVLVTITGTHVPPVTGIIAFTGIGLDSATDIIFSAAAGSTTINFLRCQYNLTNGHVCNLANWTGEIYFESCTDLSANNGLITNAGGSPISVINGIMGLGTNTFTANGNVSIFGSRINSPIALTGTGSSTFEGGSVFTGNITTSNTHTLKIAQSRVFTGATQAITHNSTSSMTLQEVIVDSSNANVIGGTGPIQLMTVEFPDNYELAGTLIVSLIGITQTAEMWSDNISRTEDSGFYSWAAAGPYFDDTVLGTFDLLVGGTGYIKGRRVTWVPQTVTGLTAGNTYWIYIDDTGTIGSTTTRTDALFVDNIVLFECLRDSTAVTNNQITVKENHPYSFQTSPSNYLHNVVGSVIENTQNGANITLNGTQGIQINGADELDDHGLETDIPDSLGAAVTFHKMFTLGSGKWATYNITNTFLGVYNNAGTATALGAGKFANYTLYVSKDNLNSATPTYFAVLDTSQYNNQVTATTAISTGAIAKISGELAALEMAQLGYIIYSESASAIVDVIIEKTTLRSGTSTSGTNQASLINTDVTNFDGWLSAADTNVQAALETLDNAALIWYNTTVNASIVKGNGYIANKAGLLAMTLPATSAVGDQFAITNINQAAGWSIVQGANQYVRMGIQVSTVGAGGSLASTALGDTVYCVCTETDLGWVVVNSMGNITVT